MAERPDAVDDARRGFEEAVEAFRRAGVAAVDAAEQLWTERGFDKTTVNDVCEAAGVTVGAFYFHFAKKEDLLVELALQGSSRLWTEYSELDRRGVTTTEALERILTHHGPRDTDGADALCAELGHLALAVE